MVAYAIPVAPADIARANATFEEWRKRGYLTAALVYGDERPTADVVVDERPYLGWGWAVNVLCHRLPKITWIVTGGADITPDPVASPSKIEAECEKWFGGTFGVMQPAGDRYGAIETRTACVSPWIGREFRERAYGGRGPMFEGYGHYFADGELMHVAHAAGCLWWREDLTQYHDHYTRHNLPVPETLKPWAAKHAEAKRLYEQRMAANWPGHELA